MPKKQENKKSSKNQGKFLSDTESDSENSEKTIEYNSTPSKGKNSEKGKEEKGKKGSRPAH